MLSIFACLFPGCDGGVRKDCCEQAISKEQSVKRKTESPLITIIQLQPLNIVQGLYTVTVLRPVSQEQETTLPCNSIPCPVNKPILCSVR